MYRFEGKRILLNSIYAKFKELKEQGHNYSDIATITGYQRQYVRATLKKYKYQLTD